MQIQDPLFRDARATQSSRICILDLPNETLSQIFNCLTPRGIDLLSSTNYSDLLSVRRTCRVFRTISSTLQVWRADDFDLSYIVRNVLPLDNGRIDVVVLEIGVRRLFKALTEDKLLLETMEQKKDYSVRTIPTLILFSDVIPAFQTTIKALDYERYDNWEEPEQIPQIAKSINTALAHLGVFPNLISLSIAHDPGKVSLSRIVVSCPSLRKLEFYDNSSYMGSLKGLCNLEKLIVYDYELKTRTVSREYLLPLDSALSLTNLQLFARGTRNNVYNSKHLTKFVNLAKFTVYPLCNHLCRTIVTANFAHLRKFTTIVYASTNISIENILQLFQCHSLASLQVLRFLVEPLHWHFTQRYFDIIRTITTHLSLLEDIQLTMGINTAWCGLFSNLRNLESMAWVCAEEEYIDSTAAFPLTEADLWMTSEDRTYRTAAVGEKMEVVFREFQEPPEVYIKLLDEETFEQWDELFEVYEGD